MASRPSQSNNFTGTNITSGGSIFQWSIRTESGPININLAGVSREQRRLDILEWLSRVQYVRHHKFAKANRLPGTGEWLFQRTGAGKTKLSSLIIDKVAGALQGDRDRLVLYFYCESEEEHRDSSSALLRTLIHQLVCSLPHLFNRIDKVYEQNRESGYSHGVLSFDESLQFLAEMITDLKEIYIVIDGLDERNNDSREELLEAFKTLSSLPNGNIKVMIISRYSDDIATALSDYTKLFITTQDNQNDISMFVEREINSAVQKKKLLRGKMDVELREKLISSLTNRADGMFLWARLQIGDLCAATTREDLLSVLEDLPESLKATYEGIWIKIKQQRFSRKTLAEQTIELLLYSAQPLIAAAVAEGTTSNNSYSSESVEVELLLDVCHNLVVLDPELGVLRFIHLTAQTFLRELFDEREAHTRIATKCLGRISNVDALNRVANQRIKGARIISGFDTYAALNWPVHCSRGRKDTAVDSLERNFMANETLHRLWIKCLNILNEQKLIKVSTLVDLLKAFPSHSEASLISACFFGLRYFESAIHPKPIKRQHTEEEKPGYFSWRPRYYLKLFELDEILNDWRKASLLCASEQGHASIVTRLLARHTERKPDEFTMISCIQLAVANGHVDVLKSLWDFEGKYMSWLGGYRNCPYAHINGGHFALAASQGQKRVIEWLLSTNRWTISERISTLEKGLVETAGWQNEKPFALLLRCSDVSINLTHALFSAASANTGKTIELILESRNVDVNGVTDRTWHPALIEAAWGDCGVAAKALCGDRSVDLGICDTTGKNALQIAALECHTDFLESLLERDDLDVNVRGVWGETPLICAVRKGHTPVVKLLLECGKVDTSLIDNGGLTAMDIAVRKDHEPIIRLLSNRGMARQENETETTTESFSAIGRWFQ